MSGAAQAAVRIPRSRQERAPRFNAVRCKRCGLCVSVCPTGVLAPPSRSTPRLADPESCSGCRACEYICPDFAVKVTDRSSSPKASRYNR